MNNKANRIYRTAHTSAENTVITSGTVFERMRSNWNIRSVSITHFLSFSYLFFSSFIRLHVLLFVFIFAHFNTVYFCTIQLHITTTTKIIMKKKNLQKYDLMRNSKWQNQRPKLSCSCFFFLYSLHSFYLFLSILTSRHCFRLCFLFTDKKKEIIL